MKGILHNRFQKIENGADKRGTAFYLIIILQNCIVYVACCIAIKSFLNFSSSFNYFEHYYLFFISRTIEIKFLSRTGVAFVLIGANVSDKDPNVFKVLAKRLYGKLFADKGNISQKLFDFLFEDGIQLVTGLRVNMKNKLMPFYDRMMLRKRYIIETINDMLKNTAQIVHSRHRSVNNFVMNLISALGAYCFFDNKPMALQGYCIEDTKQLSLF